MYPWGYSDNFSDVIYASIAPQYPVLLYVEGGIGLVVDIICNIVRPAAPLPLLMSSFYAALAFILLYKILQDTTMQGPQDTVLQSF